MGGGESLFRILAYSQSRATSQSTLGQQHRAVPSTMTSTTLMVAPTTRFPCPRIHGAKANQEASWAKALPTTTAYSLTVLLPWSPWLKGASPCLNMSVRISYKYCFIPSHHKEANKTKSILNNANCAIHPFHHLDEHQNDLPHHVKCPGDKSTT